MRASAIAGSVHSRWRAIEKLVGGADLEGRWPRWRGRKTEVLLTSKPPQGFPSLLDSIRSASGRLGPVRVTVVLSGDTELYFFRLKPNYDRVMLVGAVPPGRTFFGPPPTIGTNVRVR